MATKQTGKAPDNDPDSLTAQPSPAAATASAGYLSGIAADYAQYIATGPIVVNGARAFNAGARVPASHPLLPVWIAGGYVTRVDGATD